MWLPKWLSRKRDDRDLQKFYDTLSPSKVGLNSYTKKDRAQDFRAVFNSPAGRRVLAQIISECEGPLLTESDVSDTHATAYRAGKRYPGLWIVKQLNAVPLED